MDKNNKETESNTSTSDIKISQARQSENITCGIVMPISSIDGLGAEHWSEVLSILEGTINSIGFKANLVSESDDSGVIQKRIIQNLYNNEIVVCDVSAKNPNVMFELGIRLAFDKPTIIVKDDITNYSFDTSPIEHIPYPRDLRYNKMIEFQKVLANKIKATYKISQQDDEYSTFLKHFGEYKVPKLTQKSIPSEKYILETLDELTQEIRNLRKSHNYNAKVQYETFINDYSKMRLLESYLKKYLSKNDYSNILDLSLNQIQEDFIKSIILDPIIKKEFKYEEEILNYIIKIINSEIPHHITTGLASGG